MSFERKPLIKKSIVVDYGSVMLNYYILYQKRK